MESIHSVKKPGAARVGVLAAFLLLALLLALPCAWYAVYRDQLAAPSVKSVPLGMAAPSRPSGVITLGLPIPGQTRTVQIQHIGGQVITSIAYGSGTTLTMSSPDPRPPSNTMDMLGQSLCDRYNAWKCEKGDPGQSGGVIQVSGNVRISEHMNYQSSPPSASMIFRTPHHP